MGRLERVGGALVFHIDHERLFEEREIVAIRERLLQLVEENPAPRIAMDFSGVLAASSRFFGVLVGLRKRVRRAKGELVLYGLSSTPKRLMEVTKMTKLFVIRETEDEALETLLKTKRWSL